jgi:hypothetical protein
MVFGDWLEGRGIVLDPDMLAGLRGATPARIHLATLKAIFDRWAFRLLG